MAAIDGHRERTLTRGGGLLETESVWALLCVTEYWCSILCIISCSAVNLNRSKEYNCLHNPACLSLI